MHPRLKDKLRNDLTCLTRGVDNRTKEQIDGEIVPVYRTSVFPPSLRCTGYHTACLGLGRQPIG